jgi:HAD superfamily hydrolase (TIGR01509 family)
MNASQFDGIVFDVDGVLFDTEALGRRVWREVGQALGWTGPEEQYLDFVGRNRADTLSILTQRFGPEFPGKLFLQTCSQRAMELMEQEGVPLKPGVHEILDALTAQNIPLALATSTYRDRTLYRMGRTGLTHYFGSITTGDQVVHSKPDPEIYLLACREAGFAPARTLAVEDSRNGILSAHAAGMQVVMVPDLIPPTPELEELLLARFDSLLELRDALLQ